MHDQQLVEMVAAALAGRMIATAESCTAGRIAGALASVENASEFLRGGLVSYQEQLKRRHLGVTAASVYSAEAAEQMATGVADLLGAEVTVATTGVAGSEPQDGVAPGTVFIATSVDGVVSSAVHRFSGSRGEICDQARTQALRDLLTALSDGAVARPRPR